MTEKPGGYGKPPKETRFKPGVSGNLKGRPKKTPEVAADIIEKTMNTMVDFQEQGVAKSAPRRELSIKTLLSKAVKGDVKSAEMLFDLREHAERNKSQGPQRIEILHWLPDYPGQTAEQKTRDAAQKRDVDPTDRSGKPGNSG